jgi:DivIVA domain-containing protein
LALDRQTIEKRDFPIGRRGYDPAAVDAHLQMLADEFEALKRSAQRTSSRSDSSLAQAASEQVRLIVEAAEQSAADIERSAELEARQVRQDARETAERLRTDAGTQAREHVDSVSEAARSMLERVETMQRELTELTESLRSGTSKVNADLSLLSASVQEVRAASSAGPAAAPAEPEEAELVAEPEAHDGDHAAAALEDDGEPAGMNGGGADEEGARLIALNMALNGTPREETEAYLAENFDLEDPQALLDDVYARAGQ